MEIFETVIKKDESGKLTIIELPFDAKEAFGKQKGTIFVNGTINGVEYRSKLLSRGGGKYIMVLGKAMQKSVGFNGTTIPAQITMNPDDSKACKESCQEPAAVQCDLDVLTAIITRQSIRKFTSEPVSEKMLNITIGAGLCAPTAKNKRPCHFLVIRDRRLLLELAQNNSNAAMLATAACAVVVCGDKNIEGINEFLYADCAAAAQNMLLSAHGLGLGGVWCGVAANSVWRKLMSDRLALPPKLQPVAVIAFGWPDEVKELRCRWEAEKIHDGKW